MGEPVSKTHTVEVSLPKAKRKHQHYERLKEHLKDVPDDKTVMITQSEEQRVTLLVVTNAGKPPFDLVETLVSGQPGTDADFSSAITFEMPHNRTDLLFEAYYPKFAKGESKLMFHWETE